ncbi:uncharacterized protein LOC120111923 [Phoenix dactylifera]|uniref:Uncharacterized protein LOC120111923 n=1 Tax=Phoenix dactylifera TaxID=42345 RepID=A0A8B9AQ33_PHODC|nr:uncharacterized protein LOC120111923 [Phoenix dactylifera]XP_038986133.1 uncharacterized protein LOC120111923 [Phoenix dactylifera]
MAAEVNNIPGGWPLGLERLTVRLRAMETSRAVATMPDSLCMRSDSFSSYSSSELDTESTISFFPDRSITLGSLIGIKPGDGNLRFARSILPAEMGSDPTVDLTPGSMEQHQTIISCCVCVPLVSTILAGRTTSRC